MFDGDPDKLGQESFKVSHALLMPAQMIYLLAADRKQIRVFSIVQMQFSWLDSVELPEEMGRIV